jgi:hypothetical protein
MVYNKDQQSVEINMQKYIKGCLQDFEEEVTGTVFKTVNTPASEHLFKVRDKEILLLSSERKKIFHSTVAKLLFVAKQGRLDILLAISFLTTRVQAPDEDDWKKLLRVLNYLNSTLDYILTLRCHNLNNLQWFIDGSYATHHDMKGQSGAILITDGCALLAKSSKQKVNTRSSTETELIAVDDVLPTVQWTNSFMQEQGYDLETVIKEDNRSTILLMKNGKLSSGKRTEHLDIRYFYVKDLIKRGILKVEHCMSDDMIADFFTKPLQGKRFQILRDIILNRSSEDFALQYRSVLGTGENETQNIVPAKETNTREESIQRENALETGSLELDVIQ